MLHTVLLAEPRGFCAGVVRAIEALDHILTREPPPVYVFHEIVHNRYVVEGFEKRGAQFIDSLDDVPTDSLVVISAHGVSPQTLATARRKRLRVVDATCPLVTRVHLEAIKAAKDGYQVVLVGHEGTMRWRERRVWRQRRQRSSTPPRMSPACRTEKCPCLS